MSCSSAVKTNTLIGAGIDGTEIEILPVTADLIVSEQRVRGEVTGKTTDNQFNLVKESLAKALGQEPPSVDKPDALVGANWFTEVDGANIKLIVTGYPAYYTNFRTATKTDSLRLNMFNSGAPAVIFGGENRPKVAAASQIGGEWYYSVKYQFGDGFGWGIGAGKSWQNKQLGELFFGLEFEESGFLSPWKNEGNIIEIFGLGGSLNLGGVYEKLPYDLKLVYGLSAGFWSSQFEYEYTTIYGYTEEDYRTDQAVLLGPLVKLRWHGLEAGFRLLFGSGDSDFQFSLGFTI